MGMGAPDNSAAVNLQKQSLAQSAAFNRAMLAQLAQQNANAKAMKLPALAPPAPLPDTSSADMIAQSQETRRNLMKRSGLMATQVVPQVPTKQFGTAWGTTIPRPDYIAPLKSAMGTPVFGMAA
jgi:hypothetical protein